MGESSKRSTRIDWFDGTIVEDTRSGATDFDDEDQPGAESASKYTEKKAIGFKRLQEMSLLKAPVLTLEISHRPGFWNLFDQDDLKGDFIVLILRILANIYKDIEANERSKIATILKTRVLKSNFLEKLRKYLIDLPSVRVVEKKMNAQLWDDVEGFYTLVLELCKGINRFAGSSTDYNDVLHDLLEALELSAVGVREEHSERFSDDLFEGIKSLKLDTVDDDDNWESFEIAEKPTNPDSFKILNIFPTREDLVCKSNAKIKPNIINGAYISVEHYLDLQFKLLREDCFGPLRDGICKYMENPSRRRHENIRVYPEVRVLRTYVSNNRVGHLIDLAWQDRLTNQVDKKRFKQLMFGSLLLFTQDQFETVLCATVLDSSSDLLKEGYLAVSFQNPVSKRISSEPLLMVESEVFFEPYHQVLKVLQNSRIDDLPMGKYIVDVKPETKPPSYLTPETIYTILPPGKVDEIQYPALEPTHWPNSAFGLDESQLEAYKFALTREFAVIQGPPGTGKTFIGIKIASTILQNHSLEGTPMLVICYTNHALDQFLEGVLNVTKSVIRLGSQSKSKALEGYTLNNVRTKVKCKYSYLYSSKRAQLENIYKQMMDLQTDIDKCEDSIVSYKCVKPFLKIGEKSYELKSSDEDPILNWLYGLKDGKPKQNGAEKCEAMDFLNLEDGKLSACFSEKIAMEEIENIKKLLKCVNDCDGPKSKEAHQKLTAKIKTIEKKLDYLKKNIGMYGTDKEDFKLDKVDSLYALSLEQRWQLYFCVVRAIKNELLAKMDVLLEKHNAASDELSEVSDLIDGEVVKSARVVGVTTTAAARRHQFMKNISSPIVIVEEAAEVLEAHIVASLTHHCQHLILIGDHKQLRPTAAHYKLAKDYNLEVSLFERMIRNGVHARTLTTQRRMRRSFVELIVPTMYDKLECHQNVLAYKDVRGMKDNLYFFSHDELEDCEGMEDSWSHKNTFEAKWCVALAHYLRKMKYTPDEVTILATYAGQVSNIKKLSQKYDLLRDIKITAVDNYQGEESRIVILSLVRSNRDGKIGFLAAANRICVALSRAKEGFYMFGNMNQLKSASTVWNAINKKLLAQNAIGNVITLNCDMPIGSLDIKNIEDFELIERM